MNIIKINNVFVFLLVLIITSCTLETFAYKEDEDVEIIETTVEENSELFTKENDKEMFVFETNERKYLTHNGYTIWTKNSFNEIREFKPISYKLYKSSGAQDAGYGIIFCCQKLEEKEYMLCVMINTLGQYIIGQVENGNFKSIQEWKSCTYLNKGYGVKNQINIEFNNDTHYFIVNFNGFFITEFKIKDELKFENTQNGYVVVISNTEDFPKKNVKVVFEKVEG